MPTRDFGFDEITTAAIETIEQRKLQRVKFLSHIRTPAGSRLSCVVGSVHEFPNSCCWTGSFRLSTAVHRGLEGVAAPQGMARNPRPALCDVAEWDRASRSYPPRPRGHGRLQSRDVARAGSEISHAYQLARIRSKSSQHSHRQSRQSTSSPTARRHVPRRTTGNWEHSSLLQVPTNRRGHAFPDIGRASDCRRQDL
jgi:hypothetical protein